MDVLLCHPNKETLAMLGFCLESQMGLVVHHAANFREAVEFFLEETPIDMVVTCQHPETDKLFKYLLSINANVPCILLKEDGTEKIDVYPDLNILGMIPIRHVPEKLIQLVNTHFKEMQNSPIHDEYCRINPSLLVRVVPLRGDIFIRLSNVKYVKLFKTGAKFTHQDLNKYLAQKKVSFLYIKKADSQEFVQRFKEDFATQVAQAVPEDPSLFNTVTEVQELIHELANRLGFTDQVQEMAKSNVKLALKAIGASPKLNKILSSSRMKSKNYISSHSVLIANISCSIAAHMEWPSATTFQKLVMAALFHDIVFFDPEHARVSSKKQLTELKSSLTPEQYNLIKNHPIKASDLIKNLHEIPGDVDTIVLQHHERPDGTGFPVGIRSHQIAPLAAVFIVAHDIMDEMVKTKSEFDLKQFLKASEHVYEGLNFKKIWKSLMHSESEKTPDDGGHGSSSAA